MGDFVAEMTFSASRDRVVWAAQRRTRGSGRRRCGEGEAEVEVEWERREMDIHSPFIVGVEE